MICVCVFPGRNIIKDMVQVTVDNNIGGSASTSAMKMNVAVTTVQGSVAKMSETVKS